MASAADKVAASEDDRQTLYVLKAVKENHYQIPLTTFHRAAEFTTPCITVRVTPIRPSPDKFGSKFKGRSLHFYSALSRCIQEEPDRLERQDWCPRRFSYGGRQFVWDKDPESKLRSSALFEVEKVWPKAGSKTGKKEHRYVGGQKGTKLA